MADAGDIEDTAVRVLTELMPYRRSHAALTPADRTLIDAVQLPVLRRQIATGGALQMLIPAFPVKSPSPRKVLGILPDLGERLALSFLNSLCERLRLVHPPGARLLICSDGHVFGPAVGVTDATIDLYQSHIERMIAQVGGTCLRTFSLAQCDHLPAAAEGCYEGTRQALLLRHGLPLDVVRARLLASEEGVRQFTGVLRFMREDRQHLDGALSRTAAQRMARELAYAVIQRSWAWGELLAERFPDAIRLSIHPQPPDSIKFGIHLLPTRNDWMTPWHGVVATDGDSFELMKRHEAEALGGRIVDVEGHPSHVAVPTLSTRAERPTPDARIR